MYKYRSSVIIQRLKWDSIGSLVRGRYKIVVTVRSFDVLLIDIRMNVNQGKKSYKLLLITKYL